VPLGSLAEEVEKVLKVRCQPCGTELVVHAEGDTVYVDFARVKRIILNLGSNAALALRKGGRIAIELRADGNGLAITVSDDGPGIPPEIRERLFQPFVTGRDAGTGLGLAIVKRFVDDHGGDIQVETSPDQGTTFRVRLPGEMPPSEG
jgi:signal transduction histidine kinase